MFSEKTKFVVIVCAAIYLLLVISGLWESDEDDNVFYVGFEKSIYGNGLLLFGLSIIILISIPIAYLVGYVKNTVNNWKYNRYLKSKK